jgi:hypothetical protein
MDQATRRSPAEDRVDRWAAAVIILLTGLVVLARLWLVFRRLYDPDELQHLHAGYCVWRGLVPYRDFFEQHQPVLWYVSLPFFAIWGASLNVLFAGRVLIWFIGAITVGLTWHLGNRFFGRLAGPMAVLLLVMHPPYQEKNVEWRPDNLAVPFVLTSILCLDRTAGPNARWWSALAGASFSAAFFCTQKAAYAQLGMIAAAIWATAAIRNRGTAEDFAGTPAGTGITGKAFAFITGGALVAAGVLGFFYQQGALEPFFQLTIVAPIQWQTREPILRYMVNQLASGAVFWSAGVAGWLLVVSDILRRQNRSVGVATIAGGALTHALGLLHVPAAFHQYYLPLSPLVALLAAHALAVIATWRRSTVPRTAIMMAVVAALTVTVTALALRSLDMFLSLAWIPVMVALLVLSAVLCLFGYRRAGALMVLTVSAVGAISYHAIQFQWSHENHTRRIEQLMQATDPDDAFFDGFSGYGALRPHAFYVFWINHHSWPMIPMEQKRDGIVQALQNPRTRVVLHDENLVVFLPREARQVLDQYFKPDPRYSNFPTLVIYARRERPLPDPNNLGGGRTSHE